jgi:glycosyltransferase involved in cell wall biosynthesis
VIVDDASDDGTREIAAALAAEDDWIDVLDAGGAGGELANGRREGRDLLAFRAGVEALPEPVGVVIKVDADVSCEPDYFARLVGAFADDPALGIASGACWEQDGGVWTRRKVVASHPRGATRAYRWETVPELMALEPVMGWDGLDEIRVSLKGFQTRTLVDLPFRHHRLEGGREKDRVRAKVLQGTTSWYMGYRPSYLLMRALYRARDEPVALMMLYGYARSAVRRAPRCEPEIVSAVRERQRLGMVVRRGSPP